MMKLYIELPIDDAPTGKARGVVNVTIVTDANVLEPRDADLVSQLVKTIGTWCAWRTDNAE